MRFRDFKLRTKQIAGFAIILLIMAAVHMFSRRSMGVLKAEIDEVSRNWLPRAVAVSDINLSTAKLRLSQLQHVFAAEQSQRKRLESEVITLIEKINDNIDTYNTLKSEAETRQLYSEQERELYAAFDDEWDNYQALSFEIFQLSRNNEDQEAVVLLDGDAKEVFDRLSNHLVELVEGNKLDSFAAAQRAEKTYSTSHKFMTTVFVITIGLSLVIALVLVHYITGPVKQLVHAADLVSKGDLETRLQIESKDEIGNLADSFNQMTMALQQAKIKTETQAQTLQTQNQELAQAMTELRETQQQLLMKEKMAALGDMVAGVAHEINSPIGTVNSSAEVSNRCVEKIETLISSDGGTEIKNGQQLPKTLRILKQSVRAIQVAGERISNIVKSLKNFSRLDESEYQKVNIHEGIDSTLTLLGSELRDRISVNKDYGDLPEIACYPSQLNQVFINVLRNAANAIKEKGSIGVKTFKRNGQVHIEIFDNGEGIARERLEKIFDFGFTTGDKRVKMSSGLSTVYNIIQRHEGDIQISSEPGKGTKVAIMLPIT